MSYSSHVESIFWLLYLMLVEAEGSENFLVVQRNGLETIVGMPQTSKVFEQRCNGLDNPFLQATA